MNRIIAFVIAAVTLAGCAPAPQRMSEPDRQRIVAASLNASVPKPAAPYYLGPGGGAGLMFGAIGALATEPGREAGRNAFLEFIDRNGIAIERIVREEMDAALRASGRLTIRETPAPEVPVINVRIRQYGLSIPHGFSSNLVPVLFLETDMVDATGKVVWKASGRVLPLGNPVDARPADELRNSPQLLEQAWRAAAKHLAAGIVQQL